MKEARENKGSLLNNRTWTKIIRKSAKLVRFKETRVVF